MMKRFLMICLILSLLCTAASAQDIHIQANIGIHNSGEPKNISFEFIMKEDGILFLSDLFPSYAVSIPEEKNMTQLRNSLENSSELQLFRPADMASRFSDWAATMNSRPVSGIYSGDAFDTAFHAERGICTVKDFIAFWSAIIGLPEYFGSLFNNTFFDEGIFISDTDISYQIYDSGKYASFTGTDHNSGTHFTVSADFSDPEKHKIVFGYPENSKNYYWLFDIQSASSEETAIHTELSADSLKGGYKSIRPEDHIMDENWTVRLESERKRISFSGEIIPRNGLNPVDIKGHFSAGTGQMLYAEVYFRDFNDSHFSVSVFKDHQSRSFDGLQNLTLHDLANPKALAGLTNEISAHFLLLFAHITQSVPQSYLLKLLSAE